MRRFFLLPVFLSAGAFADPTRGNLLVMAGNEMYSGVCAATSADGAITLRMADGTQHGIADDALDYAEQVPAMIRLPNESWLALTTGTVLRGRTLRAGPEGVTFFSSLLGEVRIPKEQLRGFSLKPHRGPDVLGDAGPLAVLANGDPLDGTILGLTESGLRVDSLFGPTDLSWMDLCAVLLAPARAAVQPHRAVALADGHEFIDPALRFAGRHISVAVTGLPPVQVALDDVRVALFNGRRVLPFVQEATLVDRQGHYALGEGLDGLPLRIGQRWYRDGIGAASAALRWRLPAGAAWLLVDGGVDARSRAAGHVTLRIEADGIVLATHTAQTGESARRMVIPVHGRTTLTLISTPETRFAGPACWGDPILVCLP